ncbi:MAG: cyclic nucleotide-binding domain-containing protein [Actinobacteria bacterium]|nr:cyclic nucleotide-binding domain-containing protein [Actinomycetota bacterium]
MQGCRSGICRLAGIAQEVRFPPQSAIVREGSSGQTFYVILDGAVSVISPGWKPIRLQAGDFFGEMSLLDGKERSATIEADAEVLTLAIARPDFMKMLESEPPMAVAILRELATRLRTLDETHTS